MNHWTIDRATLQLRPCAGYYQNNPLLEKKKCTRRIHTDNLVVVTVDSKKRIRASGIDLMQTEVAKLKNKAQPYICSKINYIDKLIKDKEAINILKEVQRYPTTYLDADTNRAQNVKFCYHVQNATHVAQWQSQIQLLCWDLKHKDANWQAFYDYIKFWCSPTTRETNPKYDRLKAFKLKLLMEELPTMEVLHKQNLKKYQTPLC
ncbi:hypothetical protein C2G38_2030649 [Gigaspora rosea]|uniref:Uncharacterized protein n=1 Tax=Gigaspora rosea TaxID=44941 RepID=A0A397W3J5_9GLOM|nr:hypothetical protein C2G38_2030649 [Gigaspora rosea]